MDRRTYHYELDLCEEIIHRKRSTVLVSKSAARKVGYQLALLLPLLALTTGCHQLAARKAVRNYETVRAQPNRNPSEARRLNERAIGFIDACKWDKAIESLRASLAADVSFGPAHNNLGRVYYAQKKYYLAAWELQHAINEMPNRAEPINNLGLVYEAVGRNMEALEQYETAYALEPTRAEFIGNLVRVRMTIDPADPAIPDLLQELSFYETRPRWAEWARRQLALSDGSHRWDTVDQFIDQEEQLSPIEEGSEMLPAPQSIWGEDEEPELTPPSNQPPLPMDETYLQRSPISRAAIWRFPSNEAATTSIPSSFPVGGIRRISADQFEPNQISR